MRSMQIFYSDLNKSAKQEFDERFGPPEEFNHEICPLAIYEIEEEEVGDAD